MILKYEDLISGEPLYISGVGHIRSPFLKELKPTSGIGFWKYNLYLNIMLCDKEDAVKYAQIMGKSEKIIQTIRENDKLDAFDVFTIIPVLRKLLLDSLGFFIVEELSWDDKSHKISVVKRGDSEEDIQLAGYIDRYNFVEVCHAILQMNYIKVEEVQKPQNFASDKTKELWERAQQYLKETGKKKVQDKSMNLGNIVSKFCILSSGYTLLNVYDLTVFQLYDQFFQCSYLKAMRINDMAYSMHGGDKYDSQAWLKPIYKL